MEAKNNAYGFDYLADYNIYKKMRKQDAKDDGILYVTAYFEVVPWKEKFSIEEAGIAILAIVFGIAFVVARDIQRWRDQTEFLEDIMQVLGDKEQN